MKKIMKQILENKFLKFALGLIKVFITICILVILLLVVVQKLFNNEVSVGKYRMFTVVTGSMLPEYQIYDVVISKEIEPSKIKKGDDLVYLGEKDSFKDKIITHRVIDIDSKNGEYFFTTKGINNQLADPIVNQKQIYGTVSMHPQILSKLSHILNSSYGFFFLVFIPLAFLVFLEILDFIKKREEKLDEQSSKDD